MPTGAASPCAIIQGGDEKLRGEVQIKDLILGATLAETKDRDEYLKKQAEAQFAVKQDGLVEAVRKLLARHKLASSFRVPAKRDPVQKAWIPARAGMSGCRAMEPSPPPRIYWTLPQPGRVALWSSVGVIPFQ